MLICQRVILFGEGSSLFVSDGQVVVRPKYPDVSFPPPPNEQFDVEFTHHVWIIFRTGNHWFSTSMLPFGKQT